MDLFQAMDEVEKGNRHAREVLFKLIFHAFFRKCICCNLTHICFQSIPMIHSAILSKCFELTFIHTEGISIFILNLTKSIATK